MTRKWHVIVLLMVAALMFTACASTVRFKSIDIIKSEGPQMLTGKLIKPNGDGPFPAVVMLHGASGPSEKVYLPWAKRLRRWGYVTLRVDSFGPRGVSNFFKGRGRLVTATKRSMDAHSAKLYLMGLSFVDPNRIAVIGWSHGGWTALWAINGPCTAPFSQNKPFRAAVAFYPYCNVPLVDVNAPLFILIGELDEGCPADLCSSKMPQFGMAAHEVILKIYPGVYHSFDIPAMTGFKVRGHWMQYDQKAASDAYVRVRAFLSKQLKKR